MTHYRASIRADQTAFYLDLGTGQELAIPLARGDILANILRERCAAEARSAWEAGQRPTYSLETVHTQSLVNDWLAKGGTIKRAPAHKERPMDAKTAALAAELDEIGFVL